MRRPAAYFRAGAGAVIANREGRVLVCERRDRPGAWQFPQGGIEKGETPVEAVLREIKEETGITRRSLRLRAHYPGLLVYELPPRARSEKTGLGQVQYWFLFSLESRDAQVTLPRHSAFSASKWVAFSKAVTGVVGFKRPVYRKLQAEFARAVAPARKGTRQKR